MSETPETDAKRITHLDVHLQPDGRGRLTGDTNIEVVPADFARELERQRRIFKTDLWAERPEHRMTKTTLSALAAERNQLRRALAKIAEDCATWCDTATFVSMWGTTPNGYGNAVELIKRLRQYAHEQSQAPLDTANCQLPTANSPE